MSGFLEQYREAIRHRHKSPERSAALEGLLADAAECPPWRTVVQAQLHIQRDEAQEALKLLDSPAAEDDVAAEPVTEAIRLVLRGLALYELDRPEEAIAAWDEVVGRFGDREEPELLEQAAKALFNKGVTLGELERPEEAIAVYDEVVERFGDREEPEVLEPVAMAQVNKGVALSKLERPEDEIAVYDDVVERFCDREEPELLEQVAWASVYKAITLDQTGRQDEAVALYQEVIRSFGQRDEPELQAQVAFAQRRIAETKAETEGIDDPDVAEALRGAKKGAYEEYLGTCRNVALTAFEQERRKQIFREIGARKRRLVHFVKKPGRFDRARSLLFVLREWNSYSPILPADGEQDRGGGYFLWHGGRGVVIDPGYDFLGNFYRAGGRLADIHTILLTHAHDDHTAELEKLLVLFHQYNRTVGPAEQKRVRLCLSEGAHRKLNGVIPLRGSPNISEVVTLSACTSGVRQSVPLGEGLALTPLPAYHDDVVTADTAIGLAFELKTGDEEARRICFTGDTGVYPVLRRAGRTQYYKDADGEEVSKLDTAEGRALYDQPQYGELAEADLLVLHIGSIKQTEFRSPESVTEGLVDVEGNRPDRPDIGTCFYANHLGLLGTMAMLDKLRPKTAVVSEFGAELRDLRGELVGRISQAVELLDPDRPKIPLFPGDVPVLIDLADGTFFCHEDHAFHPPADLEAKERVEYVPSDDPSSQDYVKSTIETKHIYLVLRDSELAEEDLPAAIRKYHEDLARVKLCFFVT